MSTLPTIIPPVLVPTTVKDQPLQLDRLPVEQPCELNYRQERPALAAVSRPLLRGGGLVLLAALLTWLVGGPLGLVWVAIAAGLLGVAAPVVAAWAVVRVAARWLSAAPGIDPVMRDRFGSLLSLTFRSENVATTAATPLADPAGKIAAGFCRNCLVWVTGAFTVLTAVKFLPTTAVVLFWVTAFCTLIVGCVGLSKWYAVSPARLWFFVRLAVLAPIRPLPPWVLVPAPHARQTRRLIAALAVAFLVTWNLASWWLVFCTPVAPTVLGMFFVALVAVAPGVLLLAGVTTLIALPTLAALETLLTPPAGVTPLDAYSARLRASDNPLEQDCLLMGTHPTHDFPFLLQGSMLPEHLHVIGPPGSGKTSIGLGSLLVQLIRRNDGAVVVLDLKGDPLLFHTVRLEAEAASRTFKWFTNSPGRSTHVFNPFDSEMRDRMTMTDAVGLLVNSLNLSHGSDYGRAWFTTASRILLKRAYEHSYPDPNAPKRRGRKKATTAVNPIESFADLNAVIQYLMKGKDGRQYEAARHLGFVVEQIAEIEPLNLAPNRLTGECHPALEHAIHMPTVLRENQVVYFSMAGLVDSAAAGELGRLALYSLLTACQQHFDARGTATRAYCVIDEAQAVIAQNISHVLAQARSYGLSLTLSHQSMAQLNPPGGVDLRETVAQCTAVKQIFAARDPYLVKHIGAMSGQVRYAHLSYTTPAAAVAAGRLGIPEILPDATGTPSVQVVERVGDRLTPHDIQEIGFDPNRCILAFERAAGLTQYLGYFPCRIDWPMSKAEADRRAALPWPAATAGTITVTPHWPSQTVQPQPVTTAQAATARLDRLKTLLALDDEG